MWASAVALTILHVLPVVGALTSHAGVLELLLEAAEAVGVPADYKEEEDDGTAEPTNEILVATAEAGSFSLGKFLLHHLSVFLEVAHYRLCGRRYFRYIILVRIMKLFEHFVKLVWLCVSLVV